MRVLKITLIMLLALSAQVAFAQENKRDCTGELLEVIHDLGMAISGGHEAIYSISDCMNNPNLDSAHFCISHFVNLSYESLGPISDADCHMDKVVELSGEKKFRKHKAEILQMKELVHKSFQEARKAYSTAHKAMEIQDKSQIDESMMEAVQAMTQAIEWMDETIGLYNEISK